ncbi:hypothetical protein ACMFMF_010284 [Clarireedia jacksonii]
MDPLWYEDTPISSRDFWQESKDTPVFDDWEESMETSPEPSDTEDFPEAKRKCVARPDTSSVRPVSSPALVSVVDVEELPRSKHNRPSKGDQSQLPISSIEVSDSSAGAETLRRPRRKRTKPWANWDVSVGSSSQIQSSSVRTIELLSSGTDTQAAPPAPSGQSARSQNNIIRPSTTQSPQADSGPSGGINTHPWESWELALLTMVEDWVTMHNEWHADWVMISEVLTLLVAVIVEKHPELPSRQRAAIKDAYLGDACNRAWQAHKDKFDETVHAHFPWIIHTLMQYPEWVVFVLCIHLNHESSSKAPYHSTSKRRETDRFKAHKRVTRRETLHQRHMLVVENNLHFTNKCRECRAWYAEPVAGRVPLKRNETLVIRHTSRRAADFEYPSWLKTICNQVVGFGGTHAEFKYIS